MTKLQISPEAKDDLIQIKEYLVYVSRILYGKRDYMRVLFRDLPEVE